MEEIFGIVSPHETCSNSFLRIYSSNYMVCLLMNDFIHCILKKNYYGYLFNYKQSFHTFCYNLLSNIFRIIVNSHNP